jgi:hypothetical protein
MRRPDFIIAGAMRAGTTALASALAEHPGVHMTRPKEPNFFAVAQGALDFTGPGDQWFAQQNTADWESYQALFPDSGSLVRGEASAMYLALPGTAAEIRMRCPEVKLVLILRDPVARAHSAWAYLRSKGREDLPDFVEALAAEQGRRRRGFGPMWWYTGASRYDLGLAEFYGAFPPAQLLVLTAEQLRRDPTGAVAQVCEFVGVDAAGFRAQALDRVVNGSGIPRSEVLTRLLYPSDRVRGVLSRAAPPVARTLVRRARAATVRRPAPMSSAARESLLAELSGVAAEVHRLSGTDTSQWEQLP